MKLTLRTKIIVLSIATVTVAMLLLAAANFFTVRKQLLATIDIQGEQLVESQAASMAEWVASISQLTAALVPAVDNPAPMPVIRAIQQAGAFDDAYVAHADKRMIATQDLRPGYDPTSRPWYRQTVEAGKGFITQPYISSLTNTMVVTFALPVIQSGRAVAVVGTDVQLTSIIRTVASINPTPGSFAFLVDGTGTIITHPDASLALKPATDLSPELSTSLLKTLAAETAGVPAQIRETDFLLYGQAIPGSHWQLVVAMHRGEALATVNSLLGTSAITLVISILATVLLLSTLIARMLRRLGFIRTALDDIAQGEGDLTRRLDASGHDELAGIADAFNRFTDKIASALRDIRNSSTTVKIAAAEIAQGNLELSTRTEEQAASLEQTSAAMEELTATVRQNADNARTADGLAAQAADVADQGSSTMRQVVSTMQAIDTSSSRVADIVGVIDSIAFQTNILALNAAVEAARAGEQGRGFAVVATEVRALAQRSASAAREIKTLIQNSVDSVREGGTLVGDAGQRMDGMVDSATKVRHIVAEISTASQEQTQGISEVALAVSQMDQATQQNAALVEQATAAAQSLSEEATQLAAVVAMFKLDAEGHAASAAATSRVASSVAHPKLPAPR
jgi:methyl-accepting chemotaxis protein